MRSSNTSERLKLIMKQRDLKQVDILEKCEPLCKKYNVKLNKNDLSQYVNGKVEPGQMKLALLSEALGVNEAWLMGYDDVSQFRDYSFEELIHNYDNINAVTMRSFPMLGEIACGEPIFVEEEREHCIMADMDIPADFCLTAKGDSMVGARIYDGDIVFIKKMPMVDNGEIAAVIIGDEATLKRVYYYRDNNKLVLTPENPKYEPLVYVNEELNDIHILGKAVYFMSSL